MKTFEAVFEYRIKDDHGSRFAHACVRVEAKDDTDAERKISELLQRAVGEPEPVTVEPDPWIPLVADYVKGLEEVSFHEVVEAALVGEPPRLRLSKTWRIKPRSCENHERNALFGCTGCGAHQVDPLDRRRLR